MSNYTHTPGPWKRSEKTDGNWWHIGAGNQAIATVHAASKKRNEPYASMFEANANLIAAAPELLAALEASLAAMEHMGNVLNEMDAVTDEDEVHYAAFEQAREAITKAKGGAA